ncbi:uncharacterized protein LOC120670981 [Panicum virgatum]|uniref:uncharacterized protein LOC120670981 n=1 Tax=Panicum virgatum TaxID=38727 RepID=UPI0019D60245|nr:uncharacterized protein LOC120670981 [Panicum virgatum]
MPSSVFFCSAKVTDWFIHINFDGTHMHADPSEVNLQNFKEYMLYEMLELKEIEPGCLLHLFTSLTEYYKILTFGTSDIVILHRLYLSRFCHFDELNEVDLCRHYLEIVCLTVTSM